MDNQEIASPIQVEVDMARFALLAPPGLRRGVACNACPMDIQHPASVPIKTRYRFSNTSRQEPAKAAFELPPATAV